uniref:Uncharacterized protein n=1 Tax=Candidatus Kentrum sp. TC TaxID=2126339 RepID=A0A450Z6N5_9GAMM|nr:MAG: hypothetical protein BECKTC1821D_GA0114238_10783 [Candidatus Kentron sp. TC]
MTDFISLALDFLPQAVKDGISTTVMNPWFLVLVLLAILLGLFLMIRLGKSLTVRGVVIIPGLKDTSIPQDAEESPADGLIYDFQREMIKSLREIHEARINSIRNIEYHEAMNWERDFLKRVSALYSGAREVHAITLSSISDFWVSEKDEALIVEYLKCQEGLNIHRLFVFDSPYDLMFYEEVLHANFLSYGETGGVYITSSHNYQSNILPQMSPRKLGFLDNDFGIWEFSDPDVSILATLDRTQLDFNRVDGNIGQINCDEFKRVFYRQPKGVYRWQRNSRAENFAPIIFDEDVTYVGSVIHLVLVKANNDELIEKITNSIVKLGDVRKEAIEKKVPINFEQEYPWWGRNLKGIVKKPFVDGRYPGALRCDGEFQYVLFIQFPSISDLREWYSNEGHSGVREAIYKKLVEATIELYALLEEQEEKGAVIFEKIEGEVWKSGKFRRMDFVYNKRLTDISPFPIYRRYKRAHGQ